MAKGDLRFYIPVEMCYYAAANRLIKPLQLYLLLKAHCSGKMRIDRPTLFKLAYKLGYSHPKTVQAHLNKLQELNWIGYNPESGIYFIRGFDPIRQMHQWNRQGAARFNTSDIRQFKGFISAIIIGNLSNAQRRKREQETVLKQHTKQPPDASSGYNPISNKALTNILKKYQEGEQHSYSLSSMTKFKQDAIKSGYCTKSRVLYWTGAKAKDINKFRRSDPNYGRVAIIDNGHIYYQYPDHYTANIKYVTRKKTVTYNKQLLKDANCNSKLN